MYWQIRLQAEQRYRWLDELVVGLNAKEREKVIQALRLLTERAKQVHAHQRKHV